MLTLLLLPHCYFITGWMTPDIDTRHSTTKRHINEGHIDIGHSIEGHIDTLHPLKDVFTLDTPLKDT
ncbi:hypothetical protein Pmani_017993 [Petrolisthes manimaculis]|uniref:Uncharacterized protein n=1 Tax=Petrolisthes manimaculis TaxID=1843537 RepID=A0AAE1PLD1_9EUCA|nr:hypothetical protein Pmani_017993 [Petrolisthes manimaculis]